MVQLKNAQLGKNRRALLLSAAIDYAVPLTYEGITASMYRCRYVAAQGLAALGLVELCRQPGRVADGWPHRSLLHLRITGLGLAVASFYTRELVSGLEIRWRRFADAMEIGAVPRFCPRRLERAMQAAAGV